MSHEYLLDGVFGSTVHSTYFANLPQLSQFKNVKAKLRHGRVIYGRNLYIFLIATYVWSLLLVVPTELFLGVGIFQ